MKTWIAAGYSTEIDILEDKSDPLAGPQLAGRERDRANEQFDFKVLTKLNKNDANIRLMKSMIQSLVTHSHKQDVANSLLHEGNKKLQEGNQLLLQEVKNLSGEIQDMKQQIIQAGRHPERTEDAAQISASTTNDPAADAENKLLHDQVKKLSEQLQVLMQQTDRSTSEPSTKAVHQQQQSQKRSSVTGTSLVRDIDGSKLQETDVVSVSGGLYSDLAEKLSGKPSSSLATVYLVGGGNNCETEAPVDEIIAEFENLGDVANRVADQVVVASIPPRKTEDAELMTKIKQVNAELVVKCSELGFTFVNLDDAFILRDNTPNDGYLLSDKVHLTTGGSNKLVELLGLPKKPNTMSAVTPQLRKKQGNQGGTQHVRRDGNDRGEYVEPWQLAQRRGNSKQHRQNLIYRANYSRPNPYNTKHVHFAPGASKSRDNRRPEWASYGEQLDSRRPRRSGGVTEWPTPAEAWRNFTATPGASQTDMANEGCVRCMGKNHSSDECYSKDKTCLKCGERGHIARACDYY